MLCPPLDSDVLVRTQTCSCYTAKCSACVRKASLVGEGERRSSDLDVEGFAGKREDGEWSPALGEMSTGLLDELGRECSYTISRNSLDRRENTPSAGLVISCAGAR